jgi:hypothetical protein
VLPEAGLFAANDVLLRLAEARGAERSDSPQWLYRDAMSATPGEPNLFPGPVTMTPGDGTEMVTPVPLGVTGLRWADSVVFQVARDAGFSELVLEETSAGSELTVADLPPATYYWRVRAAGPGIGTWSPARTFAVLPDGLETLLESLGRDSDQSRERADPAAAGESGPGSGFRAAPVSLDKVPPAPKEGSGGYALPSGVEVLASRVLNLTHEVQRKDTHMACIDGCPLHGAESWIEPHAKTMGHGSQYCTRAVIAMIASLGGCRLSQDRITYHIFEEADPPTRGGEDSGELGSPYGDLGHHLGTRPVSDALPTLDWLYRQPLGSAGAMVPGPQVFDDRDDEDIDSIREFLDDGRPVIRNFPRHSTVIDGYAILRAFSGEEQVFIRVLDPAVTRPHSWIKFDDPGVSFYVTPPRQGQPARCDEPEVSRDSDGDGLVDFDEIHRFGTDPQVADSDEDLIPDMVDVYGYVFTPSGDWTIGMRDTDGDGLPKELDPDNDRTDNDGVIDGCEDLNRNGFFDPGNESDPFEPTDDFTVLGEDCFRGELRLESVISGPLPGATLQVHEELLIDRFHAIGRDNFEHHYAWSLFGEYSMSLPMLPGVSGVAIRSVSEGEGTSNGSIQVDIDQDGHYQLVTDVQQRVADYTITTTGDGQTRVKEADYELGFADHHYDYVSPDTPESVRAWLKSNTPGNVFEGDVVSLPDGSLLLSGSDTVTLPPEIGGPNLHGETRRTWKLRLEAPRRD